MGRLVAKTAAPRRKISLTPLIDVVFILLVFFMLASSFQKTRSVELTPPSSTGSKSVAPTPEKPLKLIVLADGRVGLQDRELSLTELPAALRDGADRRILVETADAASVQDLVAVMDLLSVLGLGDVALSTGRAR